MGCLTKFPFSSTIISAGIIPSFSLSIFRELVNRDVDNSSITNKKESEKKRNKMGRTKLTVKIGISKIREKGTVKRITKIKKWVNFILSFSSINQKIKKRRANQIKYSILTLRKYEMKNVIERMAVMAKRR